MASLKAKPYRLIPLSRLILAKLYVQHVNDDPKDRFTVKEVAALFDVPISINLVRSALERLHRDSGYNNHILHRKGSKTAGVQGYVIGDKGIEIVERAMLKKNTDIAYYLEHGDDVLDEIAGIDARFFTEEERYDLDDWSPLEIDRTSDEFKEAVSSLEEAIEAIRQDNGFAANHPAQREGILSTLSEGLEWLKNRAPSIAQLKSIILAPLQWVATTFGKAVVGEAAKKAAQKILDFIMSFY